MLENRLLKNKIYWLINSKDIELFLNEVLLSRNRLAPRTSSGSSDQSNHPILMKQLSIGSREVGE